MKTRIVTARYSNHLHPISSEGFPVCVLFEGELAHRPMMGDLINVWEGWCLQNIERCYIGIEENILTVEVEADRTGEYFVECQKRGLKTYRVWTQEMVNHLRAQGHDVTHELKPYIISEEK